jgi:hypothetical protein
MYRREFTPKQIREAASQQTRELREMAQNLSFWLEDVHYPSEGQNLEYVVRSYLRRRIPRRFEVSTGFISTLEPNTQTNGEPQVTRKISRQFDIIIWDAHTFPPLFRADDFVVVVPESVRAIIEVTKCLNIAKVCKDLEKFDGLFELYSWERQRFRPYTAMLAFSSKHKMTKLLQTLERFYLFDSNVPILFRYNAARAKRPENRPFAIPGFVDSICVLDQGLIKGKVEYTKLASMSRVVRYVAYANEHTLEDSFGFFERDLMLTLSQSAAEASGSWESSVDVYREFNYAASKASGSLIIEDWDSILPSLNVMEKLNPITPQSPSATPNVSKFVGADYINEHPRPAMYIEHFSPNIWAFERHSECIFACGRYSRGSRINWWHVFSFTDERRQSSTCRFKLGERSFSELIQDFEANAWKDTPPHSEN